MDNGNYLRVAWSYTAVEHKENRQSIPLYDSSSQTASILILCVYVLFIISSFNFVVLLEIEFAVGYFHLEGDKGVQGDLEAVVYF